MRLTVLAAATFSLLSVAPASAVDVTFTGTLLSTCVLALSTPGLLALNTDGNELGSENLGGLPAVVTILSVGNHTVTVDAPTRTAAPGGYNATGESIAVSYFGAGGLSVINQAYTSSQTTFPVTTIPLTLLTMNNRIQNTNGFVAGAYATRTIVTCS